MASRSRLFSKIAKDVDTTGNLTASALGADISLGVTTYDSAGQLPLSGLSSGDQAWVGSRLFISNGSGWLNTGLVNLTPSITSGPEGAEYVLDSAGNPVGGSSIQISLTAFDSDGTGVNWSYTTSDSANDLAVISNDSNGTFTFTSKSLADILSAGYDSNGGSFSVTFRASDGIGFDTDTASFTLDYSVSGQVNWSTVSEQQKIQASDKEAGDAFGISVAISGDTVIVGAFDEDTGGSSAGAAYIFTRSGSTWTEQQRIQASDKEADDQFGYSVAIDGDTAIVGARVEDTGGGDAGAAYIFTRSGTTWTQQQKIQASDKEVGDYFGQSVAISGDTVIVGAFDEDTGGSSAGAAYIFTRSGSTWTEQAKIQSSDIEAGDEFGWSAAISGDTVIVGAQKEATGGGNAGAAYIFTRSGSTWTQQDKIQSTDVQVSDRFGSSVAIDGDTAIVGVSLQDTGGVDAGAAYIFTRSGSTWTQQDKIQSTDVQADDRFGSSVAIDGDTAIVGAFFKDSKAGAAYIFTRDGTTWTEQAKIESSDIEANDRFGYSVAIDGDTVIVGAEREDTGGGDAGAAYIFTA